MCMFFFSLLPPIMSRSAELKKEREMRVIVKGSKGGVLMVLPMELGSSLSMLNLLKSLMQVCTGRYICICMDGYICIFNTLYVYSNKISRHKYVAFPPSSLCKHPGTGTLKQI